MTHDPERLLQKYLEGLLDDPEELSAFEKLLSADPAFSERLRRKMEDQFGQPPPEFLHEATRAAAVQIATKQKSSFRKSPKRPVFLGAAFSTVRKIFSSGLGVPVFSLLIFFSFLVFYAWFSGRTRRGAALPENQVPVSFTKTPEPSALFLPEKTETVTEQPRTVPASTANPPSPSTPPFRLKASPHHPHMHAALEVLSPCSIAVVVLNEAQEAVRFLFTGRLEPGSYPISWDGLDQMGLPAPPGRYRLRVTTGETTEEIAWSHVP